MSRPTWNFMMIPASDIEVNRLYQRDTHDNVINDIISNFDYHMVNPVKVVWRDTKYYAWDGQHTAIALRTFFGSNFRVPCLVYEDIPDWCDEAALFEVCNTKAKGKKVTQNELWKSRLNRGEPIAKEIAEICSNNGVPLSVSGSKHGLSSFSAIETIYNDFGADVLSKTMSIIYNAWHLEKHSLTANMVKGVAKFVNAYKGEYNEQSLVAKLSKTPPVNILRAGAASIGGGTSKYAREILNVYNYGRSTKKLADIL